MVGAGLVVPNRKKGKEAIVLLVTPQTTPLEEKTQLSKWTQTGDFALNYVPTWLGCFQSDYKRQK